MRKLMMLAAMLAMAMVAAAPAMAQVIQQETGGQAAESGDVEQEASVSNSGNNVNQCAALLNAATTGNVQNAQAVAQYFSEGDVEISGSSIEITPALEQQCEQTIEQAAAAANSQGTKAESGGAKAESKGGGSGSGGGGSEAKAGGSSAKAQLPATGGASLFALGAGALLVGGLVARKLTK